MRLRLSIVILTSLIFILALFGCKISINPSDSGTATNHPPVVTLSSTTMAGTGQNTFASDQSYYLVATASDADGDTLSYTWYQDGVKITAISGNKPLVYQITKTTFTGATKVIVSDGKAESSDTKDITIQAGASLRVQNNSIYSLSKFYVRSYTASSTENNFAETQNLVSGSSWGAGSFQKFYGITPGYYDFEYQKDGSGWGSKLGEQFSAGVPYLVTIENTIYSYGADPNPSIRNVSGVTMLKEFVSIDALDIAPGIYPGKPGQENNASDIGRSGI